MSSSDSGSPTSRRGSLTFGRPSLKEALRDAYIAGATDVHKFLRPDDQSDPEFGEAADDYVSFLPSTVSAAGGK